MPDEPNILQDPDPDEIPVIDIGELETDPEQAEPEGEAEAQEEVRAEAEAPGPVPFERFQEVLNKARQLDETLRQVAMQNQQMTAAFMQMQARQGSQEQPQQPRKQVDPETAEFVRLIKPGLDEINAPILQEIQELRATVAEFRNKSISEQAFGYVQAAVPDLQELAPDLLRYIESRQDREAILADPNRVVDAAEIVRLWKKTQGQEVKETVTKEVRKIGRAQGKAEIPSVQQRTEKRDWNSLSEEAFDAELRKAGFI